MMHKLTVLWVSLAVAACSASKQEPSATTSATSSKATDNQQTKRPVVADSVAYFAGGCFWGVEHYLEQIDGVASVESGYMGGHIESPSYEQVITKGSGHLETVRVRFDSKRASYKRVAKRFFEIHDPTQANGQGPDIGPQYLSAVFYASEEQKRATKALIAQLVKRGYNVVTKLRKAGRFWTAEKYHQNYYAKTGKKPYCHVRVNRFGSSTTN